ncbi:MAG: hypothetical protein M5U01_23775 [Ardenticatenaceae bacterium]|nr:hypothetical protein [Ardenticatenaceae bacterium]
MAAALSLFLVLLVASGGEPAGARTGTYGLVILRVFFSDVTSSPNYTLAQLAAAGGEIETYFETMSNRRLDMRVRVTEVRLTNTRAHYFDACQPEGSEPRIPCPPPLQADAAEAAAAAGFDFTGTDGIVFLFPFCDRNVTYGRIRISRPGVSGDYQQSYDSECPLPAGLSNPGPSGVAWNAWAHEIGHQLQLIDGTALGGRWNGHPSGYSSGYDLMDSCYPCSESVYGLSGVPVMNSNKLVFPGWLPTSKVVTVPAPSTGSFGTTIVLAPISQLSADTTAVQGIKIPISPVLCYVVQAKRRLNADALGVGPGIYDEGVHILKVDESADPPVTPITTCGNLFPGPCTNARADPSLCLRPDGSGPTRAGQVSNRCWPFPLWHVGDNYTDAANAIEIRVVAESGNGYVVTVNRGVMPGRPDVFMIPWLSPPMNTWETTDIWVDSWCNGYEDAVGPAGLRYGRRPDGTVIGNGDDPCANHENRIYARVRNGGDAPANNIRVTFRVTDPLGVGIRTATGWTPVGTATSAEFPALLSLAPGAYTDVYVIWRPAVDGAALGRFSYHSCVQVLIDAVTGELVTGNQNGEGEQENFDNFEAVRDLSFAHYEPLEREIFLRNPYTENDPPAAPRTFFLNTVSELPASWSWSVANGLPSLTLMPDEVRQVPVKISVPDGAPVGETYLLKVDARTPGLLENPGVPPGWPGGTTHHTMDVVAGVVLAAQTVIKTQLELDATLNSADYIVATGKLSPSPGHPVMVAIDYTDPGGHTTTRLVTTDDAGNYHDSYPPPATGLWRLRAIWQGDRRYAGAFSPEREVEALKQAVPPVIVGRLKTPVKVDGLCDPHAEYADASSFDFLDADQVTGRLFLKHDDQNLYVCMIGAAGQFQDRFATVYLDTDNLREVFAEADDLALRAEVVSGATSSFQGSGVANGYVPAGFSGWSAATSWGNADVAEYAIPLALTGGTCGSRFGLAVYHHWVLKAGDDYGWPSNQFFDQPQTWQTVALASAPCTPAGGLTWQYAFLPIIIRGGSK